MIKITLKRNETSVKNLKIQNNLIVLKDPIENPEVQKNLKQDQINL